MEQECQVELPTLLVHDVLSIGSWLSSRVEREKNANNSRARSADTTTVKLAKTDFDRKQDGAAVLSADVKALCVVNSDLARQRMESIYLGVVLEVHEDLGDLESETEIRIVTSVFFCEGTERGTQKGWHVETNLACVAEECQHSWQKYFSAELDEKLSIKIASGTSRKPGLGTYIKLFNANERTRMAFNVVT